MMFGNYTQVACLKPGYTGLKALYLVLHIMPRKTLFKNGPAFIMYI